MLVDQAARLHQRVQRRRADEPESAALQLLRERDGFGGRNAHLRERLWRRRLRRAVGPEELRQIRSALTERDRRAGVRDRGLDLAPMADDRRVAQQALDVARAEPGQAVGFEARERLAKRLALAEDGQPRETGLEPLEAVLLQQPALLRHRPAPLLVVVVDVERIGHRPATRAVVGGVVRHAGSLERSATVTPVGNAADWLREERRKTLGDWV